MKTTTQTKPTYLTFIDFLYMVVLFLLSQSFQSNRRKMAEEDKKSFESVEQLMASVSVTYCEVFCPSRRRGVPQVMNYSNGWRQIILKLLIFLMYYSGKILTNQYSRITLQMYFPIMMKLIWKYFCDCCMKQMNICRSTMNK